MAPSVVSQVSRILHHPFSYKHLLTELIPFDSVDSLVAADQAENVFRIKKFAEENLAIKKEAEEGSEAEDNKEDSKEDSKETKANNNNNNNNAEGSKKKKKKKKKKGQQKRDTEVAILG